MFYMLNAKLCNFITLWNLIKSPQNLRQRSFIIQLTKIWYKKGVKLWTQFPFKNCFCKMLHRRCLTGFWTCLGFWICLLFWISQCSEYTTVLSMSGFRIYLNIPDSWICLIMARYAAIFVNMPKSAWMTFVLHFPIVTPCLLESVITCFDVYCFLEETKFDFFLSSFNIWFVSWFKLSIFINKISTLL